MGSSRARWRAEALWPLVSMSIGPRSARQLRERSQTPISVRGLCRAASNTSHFQVGYSTSWSRSPCCVSLRIRQLPSERLHACFDLVGAGVRRSGQMERLGRTAPRARLAGSSLVATEESPRHRRHVPGTSYLHSELAAVSRRAGRARTCSGNQIGRETCVLPRVDKRRLRPKPGQHARDCRARFRSVKALRFAPTPYGAAALTETSASPESGIYVMARELPRIALIFQSIAVS
jgi:hypothetical protein